MNKVILNSQGEKLQRAIGFVAPYIPADTEGDSANAVGFLVPQEEEWS